MKKVWSILFVLLFFITLFSFSETLDRKKSLFFIIDVSKSMRKNNLFNRLKNEIKKYIKDETQKGDYVTIITFGTDIKIITAEEVRAEKAIADTDALMIKIDRLLASEDYTYMTGALDILASQMGITQKAYPNHLVKAFLFTDGKNAPPPKAEGAKWTFKEILNKHYDIFDNPSTYLYILTLGVEPDASLVEAFKDKKRAFINEVPDIERIEIPKEIPKEEKSEPKPIPPKKVEPFVTLIVSGPKRVSPGTNIEYYLSTKIISSNKESEGKNLLIDLKVVPQTIFSLKKDKIFIKSKSKEKIPIVFRELQEGKYTLRINISSRTKMKIDPRQFQIKFTAKKLNPVPLFILLGIVLVVVGAFSYFKSIPKFPDDYFVVNTKENLEYELKESQKFFSRSVSSKNLDIDDVDFTLKLNKKTGDIEAKVLEEGEEQDKVLNNGDIIIEPYKFVIKMF